MRLTPAGRLSVKYCGAAVTVGVSCAVARRPNAITMVMAIVRLRQNFLMGIRFLCLRKYSGRYCRNRSGVRAGRFSLGIFGFFLGSLKIGGASCRERV